MGVRMLLVLVIVCGSAWHGTFAMSSSEHHRARTVLSAYETLRRCHEMEALMRRANWSNVAFSRRGMPEPLFHEVILELMRSDSMPPGGFVDAGAKEGTDSCYMASIAQQLGHRGRTVLAVDPSRDNIHHMKRYHAALGLTSIDYLVGGLGESERTITFRQTHGVGQQSSGLGAAGDAGGAGDAVDSLNKSTTLRLHRVDDLHVRRRLGFAHFDVEGDELLVLRGASTTIARDRPIYFIEAHVQVSEDMTRSLVRFGVRRKLWAPAPLPRDRPLHFAPPLSMHAYSLLDITCACACRPHAGT